MQGFVHTTGFAPELLYPGLAEIWGMDYAEYPTKYNKFFKMKTSEKAFEKEQGMSGFATAGVKEQGNSVGFARFTQGYQKEYVHITYGLGAIVTREMKEDDQYGVIAQIPTLLAEAMRRTEETIATAVLNNAFDTSIVGADGQPLCSASHPNAGSTGGTQSNLLGTPADLTQTSLENLLIQAENTRDENNQRIALPAKKQLIFSRSDKFNAAKILQTQYKVGSTDNDINVIANMDIEPVETNYLTDQDAWFLRNGIRNGLTFYTRRAADMQPDNDRSGTQNEAMVTTMRFSVGWTDWRDIFGSAGA